MTLNFLWRKYRRKKVSNFSLLALDVVSIISSLALSDIPMKHFLSMPDTHSLPSFKTVKLIWLIQFTSKAWWSPKCEGYLCSSGSPKWPPEILDENVKPLLTWFHLKYEMHIGLHNYLIRRLTLAHPPGSSVRWAHSTGGSRFFPSGRADHGLSCHTSPFPESLVQVQPLKRI